MNRTLFARTAALLLFSWSLFGIQPAEKPLPPRFKALVLTELGGQHGPFVEAAKAWLKQVAEADRFDVEYVENTDRIDDAFLAKYQVFIQLNYSPYGWKPAAGWGFITRPCSGSSMGIPCGPGSRSSWARSDTRITFPLSWRARFRWRKRLTPA